VPGAAVYVAAGGKAELLGITRQLIGEPWLGAHGFQYAGSIGPWHVSDKSRETLVRLGNAVAVEFELVGLFGVDFVLNGDDVWTIEVNPRYTAPVEIVERFSGLSAIAAHVAACTSQTLSSKSPPGCGLSLGGEDAPARPGAAYHGKAILFARRDVVIPRAFADYALAEATCTPWPGLADISPAGTLIENSRPVLSLFAEGPTAEDVERRLRERVVKLEEKLYVD